ncbi:MAG: hypothetical protein FWD11_02520, partial [Micrococcales bacterium]|nr:hypothetical protein [Micrococcales bacterium]
RQGLDDGRPYVECTDTGVGMDLTQISTAFCQAGIRAADLPGYVAELNDYAAATPPIELWTNSRFGIGVLSYFMLAHAVEVHTTRLHRDGTLGHTYRVLIPGPGACFRVQDLGPGTAPGTTVRLWLTNNDDAHESTVAKLEAVVAVAVFPLAARDTSGTYAEWQPGQLTEAFGGRENVIASARHGVWWVHPSGKILSDGIVTSENSRHCFVNLTGRHAPRLSVDRKEIIELDRGRLHALKLDAVDDLLAGPTKIRDSIIKNLIPSRFADEVVTRARARRVVIWRMSAVVGATDMLQAGLYNSDLPQGPTTPVTAWRASAALAATRKPGELDVASWPQIVVPLPSDDLLASVLWATDDLPLSQVASWAHVVATAAQWDREPREVAARYAELGYHVQDGAGDLRLTNQDRMLLKELELAPTVSLDSIADAADATKMTLPQAHSRLTALGIPCEPLRDIATLTRWERELTRARNAPLSAFTITQIAGRAQVPAAAVHQRAQELGVPVDPLPTVSSRPMEVLCSRDLTGSREIAPNQITLLHAACAARVFGMPVERMLAYAQELGANLPDPHGQCPSVPANLPFWVRTAAAVSTATLADLATARHSAQALVDLLRWAQVEIVGPQISDLDSVDTALVCASTELGPDEEGYDEWDERWAALGAADATTPLNPFAVARVAARLDLGTQQAVERLSRMGYRIAGQVPEPTPRNLYAARRRHPVAEWFAPGDIVPLTAVLRLVHKHRLTIDQALTVYRDLGLDPEDPRDLLPVVRPGDGLPDRTRRR